MWILKNSKELVDHLKSPNFNLITNIKSFDFSTLYTTILDQKLKSRLSTITWNSFLHKNGNRRYKYLVLVRDGPYFVKEHSDSKSKYTEEYIIKMLEFLVDNIFVVFAGKVFQQIIGIPMGTNCAPLLADIFLYSYEASRAGICQWTLAIVSKEVLWSARGSYQTIWGPRLSYVTRHSGCWPHTVTPSIDRKLHKFLTVTDLVLITEFDYLPNCARFP